MCEICWIKYGAPEINTPEIQHAAALINSIYQTEPSGQPLHVQLDDWNIEGVWEPFEDGLRYLEDKLAWDVAVELCEAMNKMLISHRASALAMAKDYFGWVDS